MTTVPAIVRLFSITMSSVRCLQIDIRGKCVSMRATEVRVMRMCARNLCSAICACVNNVLIKQRPSTIGSAIYAVLLSTASVGRRHSLSLSPLSPTLSLPFSLLGYVRVFSQSVNREWNRYACTFSSIIQLNGPHGNLYLWQN